jgi:hypothetical protein
MRPTAAVTASGVASRGTDRHDQDRCAEKRAALSENPEPRHGETPAAREERRTNTRAMVDHPLDDERPLTPLTR